MNFESIFDYFLPLNVPSDPTEKRLARVQLKFIIIASLFASIYFIISLYYEFIVVLYVTIFSIFFFFILLVLFKKGLRIRYISHLFVFYFWLVVLVITLFSGGIESYVLAWIALIPIMAIALLSSRAAWIWGVMGVITVFVFYFMEVDLFIATHLVISTNNLWIASLHIGLQFFILIFSYVFSNQQKALIEQVEKQRQVILKQNGNYKANYESLKTLSEMGSEIISTLSIETISERVYDNINGLMPAEMFAIAIFNKDNDTLEFPRAVENGIIELDRGSYHLKKDKDRLAVLCFAKQDKLIVNNLAKEYPQYPIAIHGVLPQSIIEIPLIQQNSVIGVLEVCSSKINAYSDYHVYILENLATFISSSIQNARTYSLIEKSNKNLALLNKIGQEISSSITIENIIQSVYNNISTLMSTDKFGIGIIDQTSNAIIFKEYTSDSAKFTELEFPLDNNNWLVVDCVKNNKEIKSGNVKVDFSQNIASLDSPKAYDLLLNSIIVLPLFINEEVIGCIGVQSNKKFAYSEYHIHLLRSISIDVGIAVQNSLTFDQFEKKSVENKILFDLSSNLIEPIELDELLNDTMNAAVDLVPSAQSGAIFLLNEQKNGLEGKVGHAIPNEIIKKVKINIGEWQSGKAVLEKRSFIDNNVNEDFSEYESLLSKYTKPYKSIIVVLLKVEQKIIGTISVDNQDKFNAFSDEDLIILTSLAANASAAIERVRMYDLIEEVNSDLLMAYSKLKDLDDYKEATTAMIVHDFKNSLNTVINFSEGVPTDNRMKSIRQAGQFMLNMVQNILDVQKFETTAFKLTFENCDLSKIVQDAFEQLSYVMEQKSIKLTYDRNTRFYSSVDYDLMLRVFVNIFSNAIKYVTTNGEIEVIMKEKEESLYVEIKDNGPGIPSDRIHQVFEKYSQLNAKKSGTVRSTGIGLTFCKMVVEAHKGNIGVESVVGMGSRFYFTLPLLVLDNVLVPLTKIYNENGEKELVLSKKEYEFLTPCLKELSNWEVFDYSEVISIIEKSKSRKGNIDLWKDKVRKALQNVNEEEYNELVNLRGYEE